MAGGRIYTDAIDNSAGVDTSDHEVNIKILLGLPIADGELTEKQRNVLLAEMTDDVAALVLRDNYFQTQVLSVTGPHRAAVARRAGALHAVPREGRAAQSRHRVPARPTRRSPSAGQTGAGSTAPEARGAARVQQDLAQRRADGLAAARRSVGARPRSCATSRPRCGKTYAAYMAAPSAEARDHRHARAQQHDQPRRQHVRAPARARRPARVPHEDRARLPAQRARSSGWSRCGWRSRRSTTRSTMPCSRRC